LRLGRSASRVGGGTKGICTIAPCCGGQEQNDVTGWCDIHLIGKKDHIVFVEKSAVGNCIVTQKWFGWLVLEHRADTPPPPNSKNQVHKIKERMLIGQK
jgi:hypothetical protein